MTAVVNVFRDVLPMSNTMGGSGIPEISTANGNSLHDEMINTTSSSSSDSNHLKVINNISTTVMAGPVHTPVCTSSSSSIMQPATASTPSPGMLHRTASSSAKPVHPSISKASTPTHISSIASPHKLHQTTASVPISRSNLSSSAPFRRHLNGGLSLSAYRIQELPGYVQSS